MKDKQARALAIVALVFMGIFIAALIATLADSTLLGGSIGFIALGTGVFAMMIFAALKADGRGYSLSKMKNDSEMEKIQSAIDEKLAAERQEQNGQISNSEVDKTCAESDDMGSD